VLADRGRQPAPQRQANARRHFVGAAALLAGDAQHHALGALGGVALLDEALERERSGRPRQHRVGDVKPAQGAGGEARGNGCNAERHRKGERPVARNPGDRGENR
jgi:hypothetical protein